MVHLPSQELSAVDALAAAVRGEPLPPGFAVSDHLVDEAVSHGVAALFARTPAAASAPPAVASRLHGIVAGYEALLAVRDCELARVLAHLASGGVSPVVIKGAHLAHTIYAAPVLRPRGDTDLVIAWEEQAAVAGLLETAGYRRKVHVRGTLILGQCHFQRTDRAGIVHALDVHWRLAAPLVFRRVLPAAALRASRVPIPALGPHAWGPGRAHALLIACVHLVAHHRLSPVLLWLHDIARLAEAFDDREAGAFLDGAAGAGISTVCASALDRARRYFDGPAIGALALAAHAQSVPAEEPSARVLRASRPLDGLWLDLRSCDGWRERFTLLREHVCPDPEYMRATTAPAGSLPLAYVRRAIAGFGKWVERDPSGGDRRTEVPGAPTADSGAASALPCSAKTTR
jgi:Uncharacterised nucleotidyltransferase